MCELIVDFGFFEEHGVMPRAGAREEQDPRFLEAVEILGPELKTMRELTRRSQGGS